jgi:CDP-glycerol glycerophosphotransferase (TagB/SpsB family)
MLLSGQKLVDQMVAHGIAPASRCRIIGYAKFDMLRGRKPERFFTNDNPVFLYNPHFDPVLSSWYDHGPAILDWFAAHPEYNLIFAPHVMLFYKALHISPEYRKGRQRPDLDPAWSGCPNIRIDVDSERLFDMSYTLAADAYIGDMSSQVYEFLHRPRAVFFIDVHSGQNPEDGPRAYEMWQNGPVVTSAEGLFACLPRWQEIASDYREEQERLMAYTIDTSDPRPASERGAAAIADFLNEKAV